MISNYKRSRFLWLLAWAALIFGTVGFLARFLLPNGQALVNLTPLCVFSVFYAGLFLRVLPWWAARLLYLKQPSIQGTRTLLIDDRGVHWRWDGGSSDLDWKTFIRWYEGGNEFLLYSSPVLFHVVPKRAFSKGQLPELRTLLSQRVAARNSDSRG